MPSDPTGPTQPRRPPPAPSVAPSRTSSRSFGPTPHPHQMPSDAIPSDAIRGHLGFICLQSNSHRACFLLLRNLDPMITSEILELALDSPEVGDHLGTPARTSATPHFQRLRLRRNRRPRVRLVPRHRLVHRRSRLRHPTLLHPPGLRPRSSRPTSPAASAPAAPSPASASSTTNRVLLGFGRQQLVLIQPRRPVLASSPGSRWPETHLQ